MNSSLVETKPIVAPQHNFNSNSKSAGHGHSSNEATKKNPFAIDVYHRAKERTRWDETDSEDSFRIEPTNVGAYYERQNKLHEEL